MLFLCTMKFSQLFIFFFILISLFICVISHQNLKYGKLELSSWVSTLESVAFDCKGEGPYTGTVRLEKFQFMEKGQNRNFDYKIVISVKNL